MTRRPTAKTPKKVGFKAAKAKAWGAFSAYIRTRDAIRTTGSVDRCRCVTCGKDYPAFGLGCVQAGHFLPGRHLSTLFDERNCHAQCYVCNVSLKGNWPAYQDFMRSKYGQSIIDELMRKNHETAHLLPHELLEIADTFNAKRAALTKGVPCH